MNTKIKYKDESGIALIIALLVMVLITVLGTAAIMTSTTDVKISDNFQNFQETFYAADGGGQMGLDWLNTNHDISFHPVNDSTLDASTTPASPAVVDPADATDYGYSAATNLGSGNVTYTYRVVSLDPEPSPPAGYTTRKRTQETQGFSSKQTTSYAASTRIWNYYYQVDASGSGSQSAATTLNITASYRSEN